MPARRRDRRNHVGPSRSDHVSRTERAAGAADADPSKLRRVPPASSPIHVLFLAVLLIVAISVVYVYQIKRSPQANSSPPVLSVYERGLVRPNVAAQEILDENSRISANRSTRHFANRVLAYITPWNSKGYEMAKLFSSKLTHLSPVWYELKSEGKKLVLEGRHNVDADWIMDLRSIGSSMVLPRVVLEALPTELLLRKKQWHKAIDILVTECKDMGYDGIVLESWSRWAAYGVLHDSDSRDMALQFIKDLGQAIHSVKSAAIPSRHLELIYVIPAPHSQKLAPYDFGPNDLEQLNDAVDGFSLMTYDFSGPQNPGPNAPLNWIHSSLSLLLGSNAASKIFLGVNFYGNDYLLSEGSGGGTIIGRDYIALLEKHRPVLHWENTSAEHFLIYSDKNVKHAVFYPSLMSLSMRLEEAQVWGASLSIWEIGQGLNYFFDLL